MGRKKSTENKDVVSTEEKLMLVRLELPKDLHRELRIEAAKEGTYMSTKEKTASSAQSAEDGGAGWDSDSSVLCRTRVRSTT